MCFLDETSVLHTFVRKEMNSKTICSEFPARGWNCRN